MPPISTLLAFALIPLLALGAVRWQRSLVMALPFLVTLNGVSIPFAGVSMHLDQLVACLLVIPLGASTLIGGRRLYTDATVWWLAAILALNFVASVLHSPARSYSLTQCVNLASVWIVYALVVNFLDDANAVERFLRAVLMAAVIASAIAILAYLLAVTGLPVGGAEVSAAAAERLTKAYGAYGTMFEPNIMGSFAASSLVLALALILTASPDVPPLAPRLTRAVASLSAVALVLTFTRAAWIAALVGIVSILAFGGERVASRRVIRRLAVVSVCATAMVAAFLLLPGDAGALFRFKILNLVNIGSQTAVVRLVTYGMALQQSVDHPIIGWGTFTFAPLAAQGADFQQFDNWRNLWIGNYLLLAVHDTGLIGLALWIGLLTTIVRNAWTGLRDLRATDPATASRILALGAAVTTLLIAFLATSGFSFGYSWLTIGVLGAYRRLTRREPRAADATQALVPANA